MIKMCENYKKMDIVFFMLFKLTSDSCMLNLMMRGGGGGLVSPDIDWIIL